VVYFAIGSHPVLSLFPIIEQSVMCVCTLVLSGEKTEGKGVQSGVVKHIMNHVSKANATLVLGHGHVTLFEFTDPFDEDGSDVS
jgi:hypothetical protein